MADEAALRTLLETPLAYLGMIGSKPQVERERYHAGGWEEDLLRETALLDLRGETALPELAGTFAAARAAVAVDAGPMHIAVAVGCPTVCLFGNGGHDLRPFLQNDAQCDELVGHIVALTALKTPAHRLHENNSGATPHLASIGG